MMKSLATIILIFCFVHIAPGQNITDAEYFFDQDPGCGNGMALAITDDDTLNASFVIPTNNLSPGFHFLSIRVLDENEKWSIVEKRGFFISSAPVSMPSLQAAEYFIDIDPGVGNGIPLNIGVPGDDIVFTPVIPSGLSAGFHFLCIRVRDSSGRWSNVEKRSFYNSPLPASMPLLEGAEVFYNVDPGIGAGTPVSIGAPDDTISLPLTIPITAGSPLDTFFLNYRVKDAGGRWSHFRYDTVVIAISGPPDTTLLASPGVCTRVVQGLDPIVIQNETYTYALTGATTGTGNGSVSGFAFNVGVTLVTYALTNNPAAFVSFQVTVVDDQLPVITCPSNITIGTDANSCNAVVDYNVMFNDNCPGAQLTVLSGLPSGSTFPLGSTQNTLRVTDGSGNSATCTFTVTVVDNVPPQLECLPGLTVNMDAGMCVATNVSLLTPVPSDNCSLPSIVHNAPSSYPVGITEIVWTATDAAQNQSTCIQTVTVIDNQPPVIICPASITILAGPGPTMIVNYTSPVVSDNCPGVMMNQTTGLSSGSAFPVGTTINTFVATDANGLTSSCNFSVTVKKGRVGVNTTTPLSMLHVKDSSVVFTGPWPLPVNAGSPPQVLTNTAGMIWYADKAAFRTGILTSVPLHKDSIGVYSFGAGNLSRGKGIASAAFGQFTYAKDSCSVAMGNNSKAQGKYAVAINSGTSAIGKYSFAGGFNSQAIGENSVALGSSTKASGFAAAAFGNSTEASGENSTAFGINSKSKGNLSTSFGNISIARSYNSFVLGQFNDTTATSLTDWQSQDPLFIIGNGGSSSSRHNALTLLKNGNLGINTHQPNFRLHVLATASGNNITQGILLENTVASPNIGEAAISWKNKALAPAKKWIGGLNQNPNLWFNYNDVFNTNGLRLNLDTLGRLSNSSLPPQANLHIIRGDSSGGTFHYPIAVFESTVNSFLQLSTQDTMTIGILSGNQVTAQRSGIFFKPDSSLVFTTGGVSTPRLFISKSGNVGILEPAPEAKFVAKGFFKLGDNGTVIQDLQYTTIATPNLVVAGQSNLTVIVSIDPLQILGNRTIILSPQFSLPQGIIIGYVRGVGGSLIEIQFINASLVPANIGGNYVLAII